VQAALGLKLTFYRGRGSTREMAAGGNQPLNGLQAIYGWGWLRRGINPGV
jgi:hypothetical protein